MKRRRLLAALAAVAVVVGAGCVSSPHVNSYLILPDGSLTAKAEELQPVQVVSVTLPGYLKRRELIQVVDSDRVEPLPHAVWAENFDLTVSQVLRDNFAYRIKETSTQKAVHVAYVFKHFELTNRGMMAVEVECLLDGDKSRIAFEVPASTYPNPARVYSKALSRVVEETVALVKAKSQGK